MRKILAIPIMIMTMVLAIIVDAMQVQAQIPETDSGVVTVSRFKSDGQATRTEAAKPTTIKDVVPANGHISPDGKSSPR